MKLFETPLVQRHWLLVLVTILAASGCMTSTVEPTVSEPDGKPMTASESVEELTAEPTDLMGEWCRVKKRMVTKYTVKEGKLRIRSGRSGQLLEVDLTCNDDYTVCEARTIRGWGTPVTEILRLDGEKMNLTRIWGGAWNDKTYNFTYTRCPKW